jgi:hypothetical protein
MSWKYSLFIILKDLEKTGINMFKYLVGFLFLESRKLLVQPLLVKCSFRFFRTMMIIMHNSLWLNHHKLYISRIHFYTFFLVIKFVYVLEYIVSHIYLFISIGSVILNLYFYLPYYLSFCLFSQSSKDLPIALLLLVNQFQVLVMIFYSFV